jgi:hypothetical protein
VTEVLCNRVGTSNRKIYNTTLIGTTDVPSVGDFPTQQFALISGKFWYTPLGPQIRPINTVGTIEVNRVLGIRAELNQDAFSQNQFQIDLLGSTLTDTDLEHVEFQMTVTYQDWSTAPLNFTVDGSVRDIPSGLNLDSFGLPAHVFFEIDGTRQFRTTQNFNLKILCAGLQT